MADDRQLRKEYFKAQSGQNTGMSYHEWLENEIYKLRTEVVNKNNLLQRVSTRLLEMEGDAYHEALNYQATGETYREIASNGLAKGYADAIKLLNENGC